MKPTRRMVLGMLGAAPLAALEPLRYVVVWRTRFGRDWVHTAQLIKPTTWAGAAIVLDSLVQMMVPHKQVRIQLQEYIVTLHHERTGRVDVFAVEVAP